MAMEEEHKESSSDELLTPLAKLKKYIDSDNIFERQTVVRNLLDTLRSVVDCPEDVESILQILWKLSEDIEPSVRAELMEQVPHLAVLCHEYRGRLFHIAFQFLLPAIVICLQDRTTQVRKTGQAALLMLLEQDLVDKGLVEDQVCPIILQLSDQESFEDFRTEAVALMGKMAPMIGREITERLFLKTFANLCLDGLFHVRKMCAANFGIICSVLAGTEASEKILLSRFSYLCEDGIWNVRKACADVFTTVSYTCSLETRYNQLASLFVNLLRDQSRWVRAAAFQALGPFISTFADPSRTGLYFSDDGSHIIRDNRFFEELSSTGDVSSNHQSEEDDALINNNTITNYQSTNCDNQNSSMLTSDQESTKERVANDNVTPNKLFEQNQCLETGESNSVESGGSGKSEKQSLDAPHLDYSSSSAAESTKDSQSTEARHQLSVSGDSPGHIHVHLDENAFNSFHYWRIPIPELELDIDIVQGKPVSVNVKAVVYDEQNNRLYSSQLNVNLGSNDEFSGKEEKKLFSDCVTVPEGWNENILIAQKNDGQLHQNDEVTPEKKNVSEPISFTRIRTASVGMIQEDTPQGVTSNRILVTNANEALVTSVNGIVTDVKQSYVSHCSSPSPVKEEDMTLSGVDSIFHNVLSYLGGNNCTDFHSQITNEVKKHIEKQNIVPGELLEHYVTMSDPTQMQLVDNEIPRYCAYSLPAVAMTLGRKNWPILKRLYEILASDMQWKVRRTLAFSIHELAMILGEDLAYKDLFPVFNGFIKDLDEVRIGVLQHIADFLKLLGPQERRDCLPKLSEFLNTDNECNWRFRLELAEQLGQLATLYHPMEIREYLLPVAMLLIADKVSEVRQAAVRIICMLIRELNSAHDQSLVKCILADLAEQFAHHRKWTNRQTYAFLCHHLIRENSLPIEQFVSDVLPHLLDLSYDSVPNVRLSVAKTMSRIIFPLEFYSSHNPHHELYIEVLQRLQVDPDRDVRFYANVPTANNLSSGLTNTQLVLPV
uniref:WW-binding domain-containing protein n=1 Tax=Strigamia maritima TaxID=126957 RepID=T1IHI6_STRMM